MQLPNLVERENISQNNYGESHSSINRSLCFFYCGAKLFNFLYFEILHFLCFVPICPKGQHVFCLIQCEICLKYFYF